MRRALRGAHRTAEAARNMVVRLGGGARGEPDGGRPGGGRPGGRPPPPRYNNYGYRPNTGSSSNYFNTILPLKGAAVAGGVGGFALAQLLGK